MKVSNYLDAKKEIEKSFIRFVKEENNNDKNFREFIDMYENSNNICYWNNYNEKLYFVLSISNNFNPNINLYDKIERFVKYIEDEIRSNLTNIELFNLCKRSKLFLLILFKNKILFPNTTIFDLFFKSTTKELKLYEFLFPEFNEYFDEKMYKKIKGIISYNLKLDISDPNNIEKFNEYRKKGVNHNFICELIRNDSIIEFIVYVNKNNIPLNSIIKPSSYETNYLLIKRENTSLIEYSAFYGSIEIFKYLKNNRIKLNSSLWLYAIHCKNAELIYILEENSIKIPSNFLKELLKLHDFDLTNYFIENKLIEFDDEDLSPSIHYCNYSYYPKNLSNPKAFYYYNKYNYIKFIEMLEDDCYIFSNDFIKKMKKLEKMIFPSSLFLDSNYLYSIRNMKEIRITSSSKNIVDKAFYGLYSLEKVFISKSVISIGKSCFEKCINLEEVIFESPSNIVSIGESAFSGCKRLKKITIPPLCKSIENFTFYGCSSLEKININSNIL